MRSVSTSFGKKSDQKIAFVFYLVLRKHNGFYDNCDEDKDKSHVGYKKLQVEFAFFSTGSSRVHGRPQS